MARTGRLAKAAAATLLFLLGACGGGEKEALSVEPGFIRAPKPNAVATGGYLTINSGTPDRLIGARSEFATVEIHEMKSENGIMSMMPVHALDVVPGTPLELKPGGYHLMLIDPSDALTEGSDAEITLIFEVAGEVPVTLPVQTGSGHPH